MKPAAVNIASRPLPKAASALQPTGCDRCYHGFCGRVATALSIDSTLQAIASGATIEVIEGSACQAGMTSLLEYAVWL